MNSLKTIFAVAVIFALGRLAGAQSFNIDVNDPFGGPETGGGVPSSSFGAAANQPGYWNGVLASGAGPFALKGLDGLPTSAQISASGGIGSMGGFNNPNISGDYRLLMADFADVGDPVNYHFSGFVPGRFEIVAYACDPSGNTAFNITVTVPGADIPVQHVTGPMPNGNQFIAGITHSQHFITLSTDSFNIGVSGTFARTRVNGFQIVAVPEPSIMFAYIVGLAALAGFRRSRM